MECQARVGEQVLVQGTVDCVVTEVGVSCPSSTSIVPLWVLAAPSCVLPSCFHQEGRWMFQAVGFSSQMRSLLPNTVLG